MEGFFFLVPDLDGRGREHLEGAHFERLEVSIAFPGMPSGTSRVSETPLSELLNEEDPELLQNHHGESLVGSRYVSAATQRHRFPCFLDLLWQPTVSSQAWLGVSSRLSLREARWRQSRI